MPRPQSEGLWISETGAGQQWHRLPSLAPLGVCGLLWQRYEPSSSPCLLPLLARCEESGWQWRVQLLACVSHPHHLPSLAFGALGVVPVEALEPKAVTQPQWRSGTHRWPLGMAAWTRTAPPRLPHPRQSGPGVPSTFAAASGAGRARGCSRLHKPLAVFGVMLLLFSRLCCSLGRLIPQRD